MKNNRVPSDCKDLHYVRTRSPNFTDTDRKLLLQLISPYMDVVENRNSERAMCNKKKAVWNQVTKFFNDHNVRATRTQTQLKLCYEAMKHKMRHDKLKADQVPLNVQPNSSVKANTHMEGDVVLLNIDSKHFAASSSQPKDTQMISIKLENLDSDSEQIFDNLSSKNLTIPASRKRTIEPASQTTAEQSQSSSTHNPQRFSFPPSPSTLIQLQMKCLYEKHIMKREQHKLKMQVLREQLRRTVGEHEI